MNLKPKKQGIQTILGKNFIVNFHFEYLTNRVVFYKINNSINLFNIEINFLFLLNLLKLLRKSEFF